MLTPGLKVVIDKSGPCNFILALLSGPQLGRLTGGSDLALFLSSFFGEDEADHAIDGVEYIADVYGLWM
jgi:hypothetical protein